MIQFRTIESPGDVPVYLQPLPEAVRSVSIQWVMFTGSADDATVGQPGIYHWFEHVPFRGTTGYPDMQSVEQQFARFGGRINAYTTRTHTAYWAHVLEKDWQEALAVTADLLARPLLLPTHADAEREIIRRELEAKLSSADPYASHHLSSLLWGEHPLAHPVIGSRESLDAMDPSLLSAAHAQGYDRSRTALFIAGNLQDDDVAKAVAGYIDSLPVRGLALRRSPVQYGALPPWQEGKRTEHDIPFSSSLVYLLFPVGPSNGAPESVFPWMLLSALLETGGVASPLSRILREERHLVYGAHTTFQAFPDGGFWGVVAQTETRLIEQTIDAIIDVLRDPQVRSQEWLHTVQDAIRAQPAMRSISPQSITDIGVARLALYGDVLSDAAVTEGITSVRLEEMTALLDQLRMEKAHTIVFRGTGT